MYGMYNIPSDVSACNYLQSASNLGSFLSGVFQGILPRVREEGLVQTFLKLRGNHLKWKTLQKI